jgi:phage tail sheath gpL-like
VTPNIGKAEALGWFRELEDLGLVEGFDQFARDLVVERDATNPDRMNWLFAPDLINQFVVGAARIDFLL